MIIKPITAGQLYAVRGMLNGQRINATVRAADPMAAFLDVVRIVEAVK